MARNVIPFQELRMSDVEQVGGKNASLGEMISQLPASVRVPGGFATTADAYRKFLSHQGLAERISAALESLDVDDVVSLARCGAQIRQWIVDTPFPADLEAEIKEAYDQLTAEGDGSFAVRSKGQRVGRNPKTGEEVPILPRRVLVFRPSQLLKKKINDGPVSSAKASPAAISAMMSSRESKKSSSPRRWA